jgi:formylglycine-generating enzyme required for sulfatase activity
MAQQDLHELAKAYAHGRLSRDQYRAQRRHLLDALTGHDAPTRPHRLPAPAPYPLPEVAPTAATTPQWRAAAAAASPAGQPPAGARGRRLALPLAGMAALLVAGLAGVLLYLPQREPAPFAPVAGLTRPAPDPLHAYLQDPDWSPAGTRAFLERWRTLPPAGRRALLVDTRFHFLKDGLRQRIAEQRALAAEDDAEAAARERELVAFAEAIGIAAEVVPAGPARYAQEVTDTPAQAAGPAANSAAIAAADAQPADDAEPAAAPQAMPYAETALALSAGAATEPQAKAKAAPTEAPVQGAEPVATTQPEAEAEAATGGEAQPSPEPEPQSEPAATPGPQAVAEPGPRPTAEPEAQTKTEAQPEEEPPGPAPEGRPVPRPRPAPTAAPERASAQPPQRERSPAQPLPGSTTGERSGPPRATQFHRCSTALAGYRRSCRDPLADGGVGPPMRILKPGAFAMGSAQRASEGPVHAVRIAYPFGIAALEITNAQYRRFCRATERPCPRNPWPGDEMPVTRVSWHDAAAYARWLSEQTGKAYRLPSEAEWEYAVRAGTDTPYPTGEDIGPTDARFGADVDQGPQPASPEGVNPNPWVLYHMPGNVREWVADTWQPDYRGGPADGRPRQDGDPGRRVVRGGSYRDPADRLRSAARQPLPAAARDAQTGFRVVLDLSRDDQVRRSP